MGMILFMKFLSPLVVYIYFFPFDELVLIVLHLLGISNIQLITIVGVFNFI